MAILSATPTSGGASAPPAAIDIEAWTVEQAAQALSAASLAATPTPSPRPARGTSVTIEIPLDGNGARDAETSESDLESDARRRARARKTVHTVYKRREPIRRDSLQRREALLKGKEGSRRRQRWENDHLLSNPHAEPPLPSDWEVRPTYPVQNVPYFLAPLWDAEYKARVAARKTRDEKTRDPRAHGSRDEQAASRVPAEIKAKLKRSRGAKGLLQDLEEEVRAFIQEWEARGKQRESDGLGDADSDEEEEIVFVGRNGAMSDERARERQGEADDLRRERLVFQSGLDDHGASFGRWLVHSIATYYGLKTWSVTTGHPARREAYIGLEERLKVPTKLELPRPLWGMV